MFIICLGLLSLSVPITAAQSTAADAAAQADFPPEYQPLLDRAQAEGSVRVIVGLQASAAQPDSLLDTASAAAQQERIADAQTTLLAAVPLADPETVVTYRYIPYLALTVDEAGLRALAASGDVSSISEDLVYTTQLGSATGVIGAPTAWGLGFDGTGTTIAILDSGVDSSHPFLAGKVVSEACYSYTGTLGSTNLTSACPNGENVQVGPGSAAPCDGTGCDHGTHVAGIAAGNGAGAGQSFSGVARGANIIAIQVSSTPEGCGFLTACTVILLSSVISGLERVYELRTAFNIAAVNMSLGSTVTFPRYCDGFVPAEDAIIQTLRGAGIVSIAGTGNSGITNGVSHPACVSSTVAVGATSDSDAIASFSNSASIVDLLAPGVAITSSVPGGGYQAYDGTSMATPMVAGAWAVIKQAVPSASIEQILTALQSTGVIVTDSRNGVRTRRIRVDLAIAALQGGVPGRQRVVINEIKVDGVQTIELYNADTTAAPLTGWRLQLYGNTNALEKEFTFPAFSLPAGGYLQLIRGSGTNTNTQLYLGIFSTTWNSGGSGAIRLNNGLVGIDFASWGASTITPDVGTSWTGTRPAGPPSGQTLGRDEFSTDFNDGSDFTPMTTTLGAVNMVMRPVNDPLASAAEITALPFNATLNTRNATVQTGEPTTTCYPTVGQTVWYEYTPSAATGLQISTAGSDYDTVVTVYSSGAGGLTQIACNDDANSSVGTSRVLFVTTPGTTYVIGVGRGNGLHSGILRLSITEGGANDDFAGATVITSLPYTSEQDTREMTESGDDPTPNCPSFDLGFAPYKTVWYRLTAPGSGQIILSTEGSDPNYDTMISVWTGERGALTQVACNDDITYLSNFASRVTLNGVTTGAVYHIMISDGGIGAVLGGQGGDLRLSVTGTLDIPPAPLTLSAPAGTITTPYGNPAYTWNDNGADSYEFYLDTAANDGVPLYYVAGLTDDATCNGVTCTFTPTTLDEAARLPGNGAYIVYLRGTTNGTLGAVDGPFAFTLNAPPPDPVAALAATDTDTYRPTITWSLPGAAAYSTWFRLYLIDKALFDGGIYTPLADLWFSRASLCGDVDGITCSITSGIDLVDDTTYYLYIQSYAPGGYSVGGPYGNGWAGLDFAVNVPNPAVPQNLAVNRNQGRPAISWSDDPLADRYTVVIYNWDTYQWVYSSEHPRSGDAALTCAGGTCTLLTDVMIFPNGSYSAWVNAIGAGGASVGGPHGNGYAGPIDPALTTEPGDFVLDFGVPGLVENLTAAYASEVITATFTGEPGATWYQVWVGTAGITQTFYFNWHSSTTLGCQNMGTCTLTLPLPLASGTQAYVAIQSAGPGGWQATGGFYDNGFQVTDTAFTVP